MGQISLHLGASQFTVKSVSIKRNEGLCGVTAFICGQGYISY